MTPPIRIAISPCPNDTFAFAALIDRLIDAPPLEFSFDDIEGLNARLLQGEFDVAKASFHAALHLADRYCVLPVGAALGFGVGPLLLAANAGLAQRAPRAGDRVLCPGRWTTASLLYRLYCPGGPEPANCIFSDIMPALQAGDADYGVVIHEGRFTYRQRGLACAIDLGERWEADAKVPLPLGGILACRGLGDASLRAVTDAIRASIRFARTNPRKVLPVMTRHAQEFSEDVLWEHVRLYVNDATLDLGERGRQALAVLSDKARQVGLLKDQARIVLYETP